MPAPDSEVTDAQAVDADEPPTLTHPCPCCGGRMIIIETFERGGEPRAPPTDATGIDSPWREWIVAEILGDPG